MKKRIKSLVSAAAISASLLSSIGMNASAEVTSNPVISRGCPAYSGSSPYTATAANDDYYYSFWYGTAPDYLAYDLSAVPTEQKKEVIAVWYNTTGSYDYTVGQYGNSSNAMPSDYTIEVNSAEGGAYPEDGWEIVETVEGNTCHSRQHVVNMEGYNWIRMMITGNDGKEGGTSGINMDVHSVSEGISDNWIFFGDSITAGGMMNCYGTGYATYINQLDSRYYPIQENGGIGGIFSTDGRDNIDRWLAQFPGKYVSIAYGTNDAWGNQTGADKYYENTVYMIERVLELGKVPVLPKIPYATETGVNIYLDDYNAMIDRIYEAYPSVIKGPDFDAFFRENPDKLSTDGVHPNEEGYDAMRQLWAETMYNSVYTAESEGESTTAETTAGSTTAVGDVNEDGSVDINDAVLIMSYMANKTEYSISEQGLLNGDVYQNGDGISIGDANSIQKYLAKIIKSLPES